MAKNFSLILMRHAKSDWSSHTADIDRPLNERGARDAARMGAYLREMKLEPDLMLVSNAQRTRETASLLLNSFQLDEKKIIFDSKLYLADSNTLLETIETYAADNKRLLILAHNPGMDYMVSYLAKTQPELTASGKLMTTCAAACFFIGSLEDIKKSSGCELQQLIRPRELA